MEPICSTMINGRCHSEAASRSEVFTPEMCKRGLCFAYVCILLTGHKNHLYRNFHHYSLSAYPCIRCLNTCHRLCRHYRHHRRFRSAAAGCSRILHHIHPACTDCRRHSLSVCQRKHHSCMYPVPCTHYGRHRWPRSTVYEYSRSSGHMHPRCRHCYRHN